MRPALVLPAALEVADEIVRDVRTPPNATEAGRALGLEDVCITLPVSPFLKGREGADRCLYVAPTGYWQVCPSLHRRPVPMGSRALTMCAHPLTFCVCYAGGCGYTQPAPSHQLPPPPPPSPLRGSWSGGGGVWVPPPLAARCTRRSYGEVGRWLFPSATQSDCPSRTLLLVFCQYGWVAPWFCFRGHCVSLVCRFGRHGRGSYDRTTGVGPVTAARLCMVLALLRCIGLQYESM